jgi:hypothetical protein
MAPKIPKAELDSEIERQNRLLSMSYEECEKTALWHYNLMLSRKPTVRDLSATISTFEEIEEGVRIINPVSSDGIIRDLRVNSNKKSFYIFECLADVVTIIDLPFDPPKDFYPDMEGLDRLLEWHKDSTQKIEPMSYFREIYLGNIASMILSSGGSWR